MSGVKATHPEATRKPRKPNADCKACMRRKRAGFDGPCPACGAEMTRAELRAEREARFAAGEHLCIACGKRTSHTFGGLCIDCDAREEETHA